MVLKGSRMLSAGGIAEVAIRDGAEGVEAAKYCGNRRGPGTGDVLKGSRPPSTGESESSGIGHGAEGVEIG